MNRTKPQEPVRVWGDPADPLLENASLEMAEGYIDAAEDPDLLYIQDANDDDWELQNGKWELA